MPLCIVPHPEDAGRKGYPLGGESEKRVNHKNQMCYPARAAGSFRPPPLPRAIERFFRALKIEPQETLP